ncbi:low affinity iron permease family protein [Planctomicrobium sp. SH661]|uniref:low affinity iron permease family protein n=1 Tax=Planctomicrobium sp. SH661 TaxID=3448124 RepID=UPI003F5B5181
MSTDRFSPDDRSIVSELTSQPDVESEFPHPGKSLWKKFSRAFHQFSKFASRFTGHPLAFCLAAFVVLLWMVTGPLFGYSDTWQLVINTGTTIVTFLMVFLIQNTQNRDIAATQIKLDELIRAISGAHNALLDLEELEEEELEEMRSRYEQLAEESRSLLRKGKSDCDCVEVAHDQSHVHKKPHS